MAHLQFFFCAFWAIFCLILIFLGFVLVSFHPNLSYIKSPISIIYSHILIIADLDNNEGLLLLAIPRGNDGNLTDLGSYVVGCVRILGPEDSPG